MPILMMTPDDDMFQSGCEALVNTVNCVGVDGKGVALECKKSFPENSSHYRQYCREFGMKPGDVVFTRRGQLPMPHLRPHPEIVYILNVATKDDWRRPSRLQWVGLGVSALRVEIEQLGIKSVAVPALGCQNGGLLWSEVLPYIERELNLPDVLVKVYPPHIRA